MTMSNEEIVRDYNQASNKSKQITDRELIAALRRMVPETGSLLCLGCGYERKCSIHGCAVLREAVERLKELTAQAEPLNDPLRKR